MDIYFDKEEYLISINYQKQNLAIKKALDNKKGVANAEYNIRNTYHTLGDFARAMGNFKDAQATFTKLNDKKMKQIYLKI